MSVGELAISIEGIGKRYRIGRAVTSYRTLREALVEAALAPVERTRDVLRGRPASRETEVLWALRHVSFDVAAGEAVGIVGGNGSGKSTLLKLLSRITEPTEGRAYLKGRVGSLLEVGTGFHPELTGRENTYLNGSILGMSKREVASKFDDIVGFAEIGRFVDTPVKRYSSGMYVRLAFAVAAHLEPEVLLVDEVLAVGDAAFQRRCIERMQHVAREGRTVLFVSHNMSAIRNLCTRAVWLDAGTLREIGPSYGVTEAYLRVSLRGNSLADVPTLLAQLPDDPAIGLDDIQVIQDERPTTNVVNGLPIELRIHYTVKRSEPGLRVYLDLLDEGDDILIRSFNDEHSELPACPAPGSYVARAVIPPDLLAPRRYLLRVRATVYNVRPCTGDGIIIPIDVAHSTPLNRAYPAEPLRAKLQPRIVWNVEARSTYSDGGRTQS